MMRRARQHMVETIPTDEQVPGEFDVTPTPRALRMLGEINLDQWRCVAELCDNAIDGFLHFLREQGSVDPLEVHVSLPVMDTPTAQLIVRDTGPGMSTTRLENAVRAGWTGNDPINNLGLFGMGFNIATAVLGEKTTVWTTRSGDRYRVGVEIDFKDMTRRGTYRRQRLFREKTDPAEHGTEVIVEGLKPHQRAWFVKSSNRTTVKKQLSQAYSSMLRGGGDPISFRLFLNNREVKGRRPCIWGGPGNPVRTVKVANPALHGEVRSYIPIDYDLPERPFCLGCWEWLGQGETSCPECGSDIGVVLRTRRIHGWVGIQRYLDTSEYGIDFIRNGRKIEIGNKDLFKWTDENGDTRTEYPVDDIREGGRIVGEIHLDHCRVSYTKDRFERSDQAWQEMTSRVRGDTSLWPESAKGGNDSALFRLFQGYRRAYRKHVRTDGGYLLSLTVPDNSQAREMAQRFYEGASDYQSDEKWYELAKEEDERLLKEKAKKKEQEEGAAKGRTTEPLTGFGVRSGQSSTEPPPEQPPPSRPQPGNGPISLRRPNIALSREYIDDVTKISWKIQACEVRENDPILGGSQHAWTLARNNKGVGEFSFNPEHDVFQSATFTPIDALLYSITTYNVEFNNKKGANPVAHDEVLSALRQRYAAQSKLDPIALTGEARQVLDDIAHSLRRNVSDEDGYGLFHELSVDDREAILKRMASRIGADPQPSINDGSFLEHAPYPILLKFVEAHPEFFFDGKYWDTPYGSLTGAYSADVEGVQADIVRRYVGLLTDAVWLSEQGPSDILAAGRDQMLRARLALDLLQDGVVESDQW